MSELKVACATASMSGYYNAWFKTCSVIGHEDDVPENLDLLILTGGADVNPSRYKQNPDGAEGWNDERDEREFNILYRALRSNPDIKVLGVCRGMQLMNVYFGGTLYQDLYSVGMNHSGVHGIKHLIENPFSWLNTVNSLHHQAVLRLGEAGLWPAIPLAVEPVTGVVEMAAWSENYLGTQYHPELFRGDLGDRFFSLIDDWVRGNIKVIKENKNLFGKGVRFSGGTTGTFTTNNPSMFTTDVTIAPTTHTQTVNVDIIQQELNIEATIQEFLNPIDEQGGTNNV